MCPLVLAIFFQSLNFHTSLLSTFLYLPYHRRGRETCQNFFSCSSRTILAVKKNVASLSASTSNTFFPLYHTANRVLAYVTKLLSSCGSMRISPVRYMECAARTNRRAPRLAPLAIPVCSRVFTTSSGVVTLPEMAPATPALEISPAPLDPQPQRTERAA